MSPTAFREAPVSLHLSMRGAWHLLCNGLLCPGILFILEMSTEVVQRNLVILKGDWEVALLICCYSKLDILCRSKQIAWRCRHTNILVDGTKVTWIVWKCSAVWGEAEVLELLPFQALQILLDSWCLEAFGPAIWIAHIYLHWKIRTGKSCLWPSLWSCCTYRLPFGRPPQDCVSFNNGIMYHALVSLRKVPRSRNILWDTPWLFGRGYATLVRPQVVVNLQKSFK